MPTLLTDCTIMLSHPEVEAGAPYGFLLDAAGEDGPAVSLQREYAESADRQKVFFTVLIGDNLPNPDGSLHAATAVEMYARLLDYLGKHDRLALYTVRGTFTRLNASGHFATETHYLDATLVAVQLSSQGASYYPADIEHYLLSVWQAEGESGGMPWGSGCWRA